LCGCKTWSLILKEEHRLRVFENRVLRKVFGPKKGVILGGWRKLHNEELCNFINIIRMIKSRRMRWVRGIERTRELRTKLW
jgi:hypothetical protein